MANQVELTTKDAYEIADSFAQASAQVLDFRITNRTTLSQEESDELEKCEDRLDHMVVLFRGYGIKLIGEKANDAIVDLKVAIGAAKTTIEKIGQIKKAIKIAGALVDLAIAVMSKDSKSVIGAVKTLRDATENNEGG